MSSLTSTPRFNQFALGLSLAVLVVAVGAFIWAVTPDAERADETPQEWPPPVADADSGKAPVLSPEQAMASFSLPPGFRVELVAAEPLVQDPVAIDIDPQGRLWVVEMRGYMSEVIDGAGEEQRYGQIVVLEDQNDDGRMDEKTVFLDRLALPRSVMATKSGVLVGEPPHLWLARDTDGDLKADEKEALRDDYGRREGNPEWLPNSLKWGLDNRVHTTQYDGRLRYTPRRGWTHDATPALGQWGLAMGNAGQFYRTYNSDPLVQSMLDPGYYARNPDLVEPDGVRVSIARGAKEVWPIHTTEGVNRAYRKGWLREDSTLKTFTAASGGAVYRGARYPEDVQGDAFVLEPAANLVRRFEITRKKNGRVEADNAYDRAEFMASTDERFRPVNAASAPDGTLYVVDMYQGVIQHRNYLSQYLKDYIERRGLETPAGLGRIYRIVYEPTAPREEQPRLASATDRQLVRRLTDPNGWWRDTAQQLLVERRAAGVAPALRTMVRSAESRWGRLHALWTLEGLNELSLETVRHALNDPAAEVRAAAVRVAEPWLREGNARALRSVAALAQDAAPRVRLQLAASMGEAPPAPADSVRAALLTRVADQPYLIDAVVSGLEGRELPFLKRLMKRDDWRAEQPGYAETVHTLAATIINGGASAKINRLVRLIGDRAGLAQWQRLALLDGIETLIPEAEGSFKPPLKLSEKPAALARAVQASDSTVRRRAKDVAGRVVWPGKPGYEPVETTLVTAEEKKRFRRGEQQYLRVCAACHQADGAGQDNVAASLVGSPWVQGQPKDLVRILLDGKEGEIGVMPGHRKQLSDEQIAAIATYVRNAWQNEASPLTPSTIEEVRRATATRETPWTEKELRIIDH